jgi:hypothetical protein
MVEKMTDWHYQVFLNDIDKDKRFHYYTIHEVYHKPFMYSDRTFPFGETKKELIHDLEMMLADAKKYKVLSLKKLEEKYK